MSGMRRHAWPCVSCLVLLGCRVGGSHAIDPELSAVDPATRALDAGGADAGLVVDAGVSGRDASLADLDAAGAEGDAGCAAGCGRPLSVPPGCEREDHEGHAYLFCADQRTWSEARSACQSAGADLLIVDDEAENAFVASALTATSWIGANDRATEGSFVWIVPGGAEGGAPVAYTHWMAATPDNCLGGVFGQQDCVRIGSNGQWNDSDCEGGCTEGLFAFVCQSY